MTQRGQIFTNGSAETPREMARRYFAGFDTPYGIIAAPDETETLITYVGICPSCGRTDGAPVRLGTGETSSTTGYCDEGEGCTLCDPRREREQPFEVQEDGDVTF